MGAIGQKVEAGLTKAVEWAIEEAIESKFGRPCSPQRVMSVLELGWDGAETTREICRILLYKCRTDKDFRALAKRLGQEVIG